MGRSSPGSSSSASRIAAHGRFTPASAVWKMPPAARVLSSSRYGRPCHALHLGVGQVADPMRDGERLGDLAGRRSSTMVRSRRPLGVVLAPDRRVHPPVTVGQHVDAHLDSVEERHHEQLARAGGVQRPAGVVEPDERAHLGGELVGPADRCRGQPPVSLAAHADAPASCRPGRRSPRTRHRRRATRPSRARHGAAAPAGRARRRPGSRRPCPSKSSTVSAVRAQQPGADRREPVARRGERAQVGARHEDVDRFVRGHLSAQST